MIGAAVAGIGAAVAFDAASLGIAAQAASTAATIPFDDFQEWGRTAVGWGQKAAGAAKAMAEMTVAKAAALDPAKVQAAKQFYENAVANGKGGAAAAARVQLMQHILDLQH